MQSIDIILILQIIYDTFLSSRYRDRDFQLKAADDSRGFFLNKFFIAFIIIYLI
uniref:Uncharacterized protein n=1 Tax=Heterorhabditis bacteriophora TaxID=37862 RepID=A0A1I7WEP0_HETBA